MITWACMVVVGCLHDGLPPLPSPSTPSSDYALPIGCPFVAEDPSSAEMKIPRPVDLDRVMASPNGILRLARG